MKWMVDVFDRLLKEEKSQITADKVKRMHGFHIPNIRFYDSFQIDGLKHDYEVCVEALTCTFNYYVNHKDEIEEDEVRKALLHFKYACFMTGRIEKLGRKYIYFNCHKFKEERKTVKILITDESEYLVNEFKASLNKGKDIEIELAKCDNEIREIYFVPKFLEYDKINPQGNN